SFLSLRLGALLRYPWTHITTVDSFWTQIYAELWFDHGTASTIYQYRPWLDRNFRSLHILRQLTQSFPEDGSVTAKTVEIREQRAVTCTGVAHDNAALLRVLGQLRGTSAVNDLKVSQIRGKKTMQFAFDFRWEENVRSENP
ncbi:MAG: hypothetical protein N3B01_11460, partial [Verrucomicrobiae bacterium]|nr:hypothetical protein [Verrucomicrobiae bacterium]